MLLNFLGLVEKYDIKANGVINVGAHYCQEYPDYVKIGCKKFLLIEPCKETFAILRDRVPVTEDNILINCACGELEERRVMYTGSQNEGQSNSLLRMAKHLDIHPGITLPTTEIVSVKRLDNLVVFKNDYNLLVMDCQGFEGRVLLGAPETLKYIDWIYSEINRDDVYEDCTKVDQMDCILSDFERIETGTWVGGMWTDCLYKRKDIQL